MCAVWELAAAELGPGSRHSPGSGAVVAEGQPGSHCTGGKDPDSSTTAAGRAGRARAGRSRTEPGDRVEEPARAAGCSRHRSWGRHTRSSSWARPSSPLSTGRRRAGGICWRRGWRRGRRGRRRRGRVWKGESPSYRPTWGGWAAGARPFWTDRLRSPEVVDTAILPSILSVGGLDPDSRLPCLAGTE